MAFVFALLIMAAVPTYAHAQSQPSVAETGSCPTRELLTGLNPSLNDGSSISLQRRIGTPVRPDLPLYRNATLTDPKVQTKSLGYDDDVELLLPPGTVVGQNSPALVRRLADSVCGWLNARDLEQNATPLLLIQIPGFDREVDRLKLPNKLHARVVVKNRLDQQTGYSLRVPLFIEPFEGTEPPESQWRNSLGYFEVLSVFEVRHASGRRCARFFEDGCFLRIGSTTSVRNAQATRTHGWVLGKDVEIWPSALAIYYGLGKQNIKIHKTEPSARIGTPFNDASARLDVLALQPEGRYQEPKDINIMRYPVIRGTPFISRQRAARSQSESASSESASYVYEVVFSGQACIQGQSGCIPEPQVKDEVARLGKAVKAIGNIDVLFVVDATESMGPYVRSVVAAIRQRVSQLAARNEMALRYSAVLYGDYNETKDGGLDFFALPFSAANDLTGLDKLQTLGTYVDIHEDKPEAPFAALERAATNANWSVEAAQRLIIWIGDHGNREPGAYRTAKGKYSLTEERTAQTVIAAIEKIDERMRANAAASGGTGTKTRFVSIQVQGGGRGSQDDHFTKFRKDADAIGLGLGERVFKTIPAPGNMKQEQEVEALTRKIADQIQLNIEAARVVGEAVRGALGGDISRLQPDSNVPAALLAKDLLSQMGFPPERLVEMGRRIQLVRNGFVYQSGSRDPDYRYWLGLRQPEFNDIRVRARSLCENLRYSDRVGYVEESILALVKAVTFSDMQPGESVKDFYSRVFSVPAERISTMLEGTPEEFVRRWRGYRQAGQPSEGGQSVQRIQQQILTQVCRSAHLLEFVGSGQSVDNPDRDIQYTGNQTSIAPTATVKKFDWRWHSPDARSQWYLIPMEFLP